MHFLSPPPLEGAGGGPLKTQHMNRFQAILSFFLLWALTASCNDDGTKPEPAMLQLMSINVGSQNLSLTQPNTNAPIDKPVVVWFGQALDTATVRANIKLLDAQNNAVAVVYSYLDDFRAVSMSPQTLLGENAEYRLSVTAELKGKKKEAFVGIDVSFGTLILPLTLKSVVIDANTYYGAVRMQAVSLRREIILRFSPQVSAVEALQHVTRSSAKGVQALTLLQAGADGVVTLRPSSDSSPSTTWVGRGFATTSSRAPSAKASETGVQRASSPLWLTCSTAWRAPVCTVNRLVRL